jgi:hypothetical protein
VWHAESRIDQLRRRKAAMSMIATFGDYNCDFGEIKKRKYHIQQLCVVHPSLVFLQIVDDAGEALTLFTGKC